MFFYDLNLDCQLVILAGISLNGKLSARLVLKEWKIMLELALNRRKVCSNGDVVSLVAFRSEGR